MKPNIFDISTKELSQDAFITWLIQWADSENSTVNEELHRCGLEFISDLIKKGFGVLNEDIKSVKADRQWGNIDIRVIINDKYLIIIEDKTNTGEHSGQLSRYKELAQRWCKEEKTRYPEPICIYLKTGNESLASLNKIEKEYGFKVYNRQDLLSILEKNDRKNEIKNDIYNDFTERLKRIETYNNEWENKTIRNWAGSDWQGFFQYLDQKLKLLDWKFVNNPNGGFWYALINWDTWEDFPVYLQIEESKLCFKVSTHSGDVSMPQGANPSIIRNQVSGALLKAAQEKKFSEIIRPSRFGKGTYMTVAIVLGENWLGYEDQKIEKDKVVEKLNHYLGFLRETIRDKNFR